MKKSEKQKLIQFTLVVIVAIAAFTTAIFGMAHDIRWLKGVSGILMLVSTAIMLLDTENKR